MASYIIDWQQHEEYVPREIMKVIDDVIDCKTKYFKINPLNICTKDGIWFEIDARMIIQLENDSLIIKNFGSISIFVEDMLNPLIKNFLNGKERAIDLFSNRLKIVKELIDILQIELAKYDVRTQSFIIVYMQKKIGGYQ